MLKLNKNKVKRRIDKDHELNICEDKIHIK